MKTITHSILLFTFMLFANNILAQEDIKLELKEVHAIGNELHIDFLLENNGPDVVLGINFSKIKLYDSKGNVYNPSRIVFAQSVATYGGASQSCIQGIPMKLKFVFTGAPSKLLLVKSLMFEINRKSDNKNFPIKRNNIIVPTTSNKLIAKALVDTFFMEVAPKVFAQLVSLKHEQQQVFIEFIVLNTDHDKDMAFGFRDTRIIDNLGNSMKLKTIDFSGKQATYGGVSVEMPEGVPMKLTYKFELVDPSATMIKIFEFTSGNVKFQIRDISLKGFVIPFSN